MYDLEEEGGHVLREDWVAGVGEDGDESAEDVEEVGVHQPVNQVLAHQDVQQSAQLVLLQDLAVLLQEVQNLKDVSALFGGESAQDADALV